jgi:hypothetical protein
VFGRMVAGRTLDRRDARRPFADRNDIGEVKQVATEPNAGYVPFHHFG